MSHQIQHRQTHCFCQVKQESPSVSQLACRAGQFKKKKKKKKAGMHHWALDAELVIQIIKIKYGIFNG